MTSENFTNCKLKHDGRFFLLFMDNAGCHPADVTENKIVFFPSNTMSKVQSLDLGITIGSFYCDIITKIEESLLAADVVRLVDVLHAIGWIAEAWKSVKAVVITRNAFRMLESWIKSSKFVSLMF